ncbi:hypothetical protein [Nonomuraea jabiensis]|uniref:Uncharacterized protein n=1 Tax=Nonomuraea jabiensis TaxID=882448 RepID=A0A7W9GFF0_9ACTN|nr:hypothetical protein [Nonomuraea jabiensis]MBB5782799.1 hypothetical protein [Nonomuraea jabiensis]
MASTRSPEHRAAPQAGASGRAAGRSIGPPRSPIAASAAVAIFAGSVTGARSTSQAPSRYSWGRAVVGGGGRPPAGASGTGMGRSGRSAPRRLFLDEPTTGFDPRSRAELWSVVGVIDLAAGLFPRPRRRGRVGVGTVVGEDWIPCPAASRSASGIAAAGRRKNRVRRPLPIAPNVVVMKA